MEILLSVCHSLFSHYLLANPFKIYVTVDWQVEKVVFLVFYSGERAKTKITKICEAFGANRYVFPEDDIRQAQMINEVSSLYIIKIKPFCVSVLRYVNI